MPDDDLQVPESRDEVPDDRHEGDPAKPTPSDANPAERAADDLEGTNSEADATPEQPGKPGKGKAKLVKMTEHWADDQGEGDSGGSLQAVRLGASETAMVPFIDAMEMVKLHYVEEPDIHNYVRCNLDVEDPRRARCVLCQAGQEMAEKGLLPVYAPATRSIVVLPIGSSSHPGALRPQVMPIVRSGKRVAMLIRKPDRTTFKVAIVELTEGMDDGAAIIKAFVQRLEAGEVELGSIFPRLDNRDLAALPRIATLLKLKGIDLDGLD